MGGCNVNSLMLLQIGYFHSPRSWLALRVERFLNCWYQRLSAGQCSSKDSSLKGGREGGREGIYVNHKLYTYRPHVANLC